MSQIELLLRLVFAVVVLLILFFFVLYMAKLEGHFSERIFLLTICVWVLGGFMAKAILK